MKHSWKRVAIALFAGVVLCAAGRPAAAQDPYTIPVVIPLSGSTAFIGETMQRSFRVLEETINKEGGIRGRPVHFDIRDDQSSPQNAVQVAQGLMNSKPPVILGSAIVAQCLAMEPLTRGTAVQYCISPGVHPDYGAYMFSAGFSTSEQTQALLRYLGARKLRKLVTMTSTDATGQDADRQLASAVEINRASGVHIVDSEHFNPTDPSVSAQMQRIKALAPDAIIVWTTGPAFGTVLHAYSDAGMHVPVVTTNGNLTSAAMKQFAAYLPDELLFPTPQFVVGAPAASSPAHSAIVRYLEAIHAAGVQNDYQVGVVWDPALITIDAVKKLGFDATAQQIHDYILAQHHWVGIMGTYDFEQGDAAQRGLHARDILVSRWDKSKTAWVAVSKPGGQP